ncbi:hypothetical protein GCM10009798_43490 [Nocardioides panacihumi]|uniref:Uncharacterized protein n=1 Tax=Nocardioides panacihumi TaxID=400774 RepID=A0ABN2RZT4_9ACTN
MIPFEEFYASNQLEAQRLARDPNVKPLYVRVMFAAQGWANLIGHAEFALGGLAGVLTSSNPRTGEIHIPSRQQVTNEIRRAVDMGLIDEMSSVRCLVPNQELYAKVGGKGGRTCRHHRIRSESRQSREGLARLSRGCREGVASDSVYDTPGVSRSYENDTPGVSPRNPRGVAVSANRPISDLFCPEPSGSVSATDQREAS